MILQILIAKVAGWVNRHQQQVIAYLQEENRILKALATLATPNTLMRWYKRLVAQKVDGSQKRNKLGRPRVPGAIEQLVLCLSHENPTWGYRRIQGTLANLGRHIDKITVRNILRHHIDPAPKRREEEMSESQFLKMHWEVLAATDFFTVEVATWHGLVTYSVLSVMAWYRTLPVVSVRNPLPRTTLISSWVGCMKLDALSSSALYVDTNVWYMYLCTDSETRPVLTTFVGRVVRGSCDAFVGIPVLDKLVYRLLLARIRDATGRNPLEALHVALMQRLNLTAVTTDDTDFDRVSTFTRHWVINSPHG